MSRIFFMKRVLAMLGSGRMFQRGYSMLLRIAALITAIGGAVFWILTWRVIAELERFYAYYYRAGSRIAPAGIMFQILMVVLIYCLVHTLLIRARTVEELQPTDYIIIPLFSVTLKLLGEISACLFIFSGLAGGLSIWIAGGNILGPLGISSISLGTNDFIGGLLTMLLGLLLAFASLVTFYYLSEVAIVLVDIATNTRSLRDDAGSNEQENRAG